MTRIILSGLGGLLLLAAAIRAQDAPTGGAAAAKVGAAASLDSEVLESLRTMAVHPTAVTIRTQDLGFFDDRTATLPLVEWALTTPLATPNLAGQVMEACNVTGSAKVADVLGFQSRLLARTVRRGLVGDPLEKAKQIAAEPDVLPSVIVRFFRLANRELNKDEAADLSTKCRTLPPELAKGAALLLYVMADAEEWAREAARIRGDKEWLSILETAHLPPEDATATEDRLTAYRRENELIRCIDDFDSRLLFAGAQDIAFAVGEIEPELTQYVKRKRPRTDFSVSTPSGEIWIGEGQPNGADRPILLSIDLSGNDTYASAGNNRPGIQHVSVTIDVTGADRYQAPESRHGTFGAGECGIGMLFDLAGDDTYLARSAGLGSGVFGVGVLYDAAGKDEYSTTEFGQGAAIAGAGLLIDRSGDDRYYGFTQVQGYGGPQGIGLLIDLDGSDRFVADDAEIRYPSAQSNTHNNSMSQGAGMGIRGDYREGFNSKGGIGILYDRRGNDIYSAGIFAQGVGYWFGMGLLLDGDGGDQYLGQWYVQGASAHFAAGLLLDRGGDDTYIAKMNMAQGGGHDLGIGVLADEAGDDLYESPAMSLGAGNASGIGWLLDRAGDDTYKTDADTNLGWASDNDAASMRSLIPSIGLFMDLSGRNDFPGSRDVSAGVWTNETDALPDTVRGIGRGVDAALTARLTEDDTNVAEPPVTESPLEEAPDDAESPVEEESPIDEGVGQ